MTIYLYNETKLGRALSLASILVKLEHGGFNIKPVVVKGIHVLSAINYTEATTVTLLYCNAEEN